MSPNCDFPALAFGPNLSSSKSNQAVRLLRLVAILCLVVTAHGFAQTMVPCPSLAPTTVPSQSNFFVAPGGTATGTGTLSSPWDLQTALNQPSTVTPGSTIWLLGGTYRVVAGSDGFQGNLNGTNARPIVVRNYNGQRVTIDGKGAGHALTVNGSYTWYWGLEVVDTSTSRTTSTPGSFANTRAGGVVPYGTGNKFINMVVHDLAGGLGGGAASPDTEYYGNLVYYNGWIGPDRRHGHGFYLQNQTGLKVACDNFVGDNAEEGFQIYGSSKASLVGIRLFGNVTYNTSSWPTPNFQYNYIMAGGGATGDTQVVNAYSFFTPSSAYGFHQFIYPGISVESSIFVGGQIGPELAATTGFTGNRIYMPTNAARELTYDGGAAGAFDSNRYYVRNNFYNRGASQSFTTWQGSTGFDKSTIFTTTAPTGAWVYVRPNAYESKRANIVIYNWDLAASASVDLSGVLSVGDHFQIQDAQNFYGPPVVRGTYSGGPVSILMAGLTKESIIGSTTPAHTAPSFGTFVLLGPGNAPPPPPSSVSIGLSPSMTSLSPGTSQQFSTTVTGTSNTAVTWSATGGTISSTGLYTAPNSGGTYILRVTSVADPTKSATATVTVNTVAPPVGVSITPASVVLTTGASQQFSATVTGASNTAVTWSATGGTISSTGFYTAPSSTGNYTVNAASTVDSTKSAKATITVTTPTVSGSIPNALGYWTFDAGYVSGTTIYDQSGHGFDLTGYNTTSIPGVINQALHLSGINAYAKQLVPNAQLDLNTDMTLTTWIRTVNSSRVEAVISKYDAAGAEFGYLLRTTPAGVAELQIGGNNLISGSRITTDITKINDGQWHHLAVVIHLGPSGNVTFYVDGMLSSIQSRQFKAGGSSAALQIGLNPWSAYGNYFTGDLDQVTAFNHGLSATEIAALLQP